MSIKGRNCVANLQKMTLYNPNLDLVNDNVYTNKNIKMSSFKSSENIQKKEGEPDRSVSDNLILFSDPERTGNLVTFCQFLLTILSKNQILT